MGFELHEKGVREQLQEARDRIPSEPRRRSLEGTSLSDFVSACTLTGKPVPAFEVVEEIFKCCSRAWNWDQGDWEDELEWRGANLAPLEMRRRHPDIKSCVSFYREDYRHPVIRALFLGEHGAETYLDEAGYPVNPEMDEAFPEILRPYFSPDLFHRCPWPRATLLSAENTVFMHWLHVCASRSFGDDVMF